MITSEIRKTALSLLARWSDAAEKWWYSCPENPALGCYGTGYDHWGNHTNLKYAAAMAVLARFGEDLPPSHRQRCLYRALAAFRFSLGAHLAIGKGTLHDSVQWGNTWITALALERFMHGMYLLDEHLTDEDRDMVRRVLISEANWLTDHYEIVAGQWNSSGKNKPESNLWNGAICWRTAESYPDHPRASAWRERAHEFFINGVSIPADASDPTIVAGKPICQRFRGANFFPDFALDHHGYLNVGYMVICASNAAILHFDLKMLGKDRPETLDHHQRDLWQVLRRMVFTDGRLARIGGDTRARYGYCQEFLLPSLLYAADHLGDTDALAIVPRQLQLMQKEFDHNGDGSFYGDRLDAMKRWSPYYYCRLESDRANALGQLIVYLDLVDSMRLAAAPTIEKFEQSCEGVWSDQEHGAVLHRCPTRLASFSWRASGLAQGMCLPPGRGDEAEWLRNLAGYVRFIGASDSLEYGLTSHRKVMRHAIKTFTGGFITCGCIAEGLDLKLDDGWRSSAPAAEHQIIFAALPDGHTVVGMQFATAVNYRSYPCEIKGLHLNLPNDVYQGFRREIVSQSGTLTLASPASLDELIDLNSRWAVSGAVGVLGIYGSKSLVISRAADRRGGRYRTLFVEELCWPGIVGTRPASPGEVLIDCAWLTRTGATADQMQQTARTTSYGSDGLLRTVDLQGADGVRYRLIANFSDQPTTPAECAGPLSPGEAVLISLETGKQIC